MVRTASGVPELSPHPAPRVLPSDVLAAVADSRAPNTVRVQRGQWRRFEDWCRPRQLHSLGAAPADVAAYLVEASEAGRAVATIRSYAASIAAAHAAAGLPSPTADEVVKRTIAGLARRAVRHGVRQRQAAALTAEALAAIVATATIPRRSRGGALETPEGAALRAAVDVALVHVMRDALLRRSEAAALTWADVEHAGAGSSSGRLTLRSSKTDQEGGGAVLYLSQATMARLEAIRPEDASSAASVFRLGPQQLARRLAAAARAAGLGEGFTGHSARVGMARDLAAAGAELPELMQAGRWASSQMPARYTRRESASRSAVARYYGETAPRGR